MPGQTPTYDCVILSGGGAKGSFGAGAAEAIHTYRKLRNNTCPICYVGTSAGALNAAVLACSDDAGPLIKFWTDTSNWETLGCFPYPRLRAAWKAPTHALRSLFGYQEPFSIYSNKLLHATIQACISFDKLKYPLVVTATDYTNATLRAFYASEVLQKLVDGGDSAPYDRPRLQHWRLIDSQESLGKALLASTAIPIFFPPIHLDAKTLCRGQTKSEASWFIDGGVGNHTPTPDAAVLLKELRRQGLGGIGDVYCIKQDPPSLAAAHKLKLGSLSILERTLDAYHYIHTEYVVRGWRRINNEIKRHHDRVAEFDQWIDAQTLPEADREAIKAKAHDLLGSHGGKAERFEAQPLEIEPSQHLGNSLDFSKKTIREHILHGYNVAVKALFDGKKINDSERQTMLETPPIHLGQPRQ
ncbi:patatin-like phospholipase [mine drainage metagenome]|uniref:Patatin-like phospholipase n=1 Tax=mine drainage metagenome TaxID=410659 RepID=A0A1J5STN9_9ZZZZ